MNQISYNGLGAKGAIAVVIGVGVTVYFIGKGVDLYYSGMIKKQQALLMQAQLKAA